MALVNVQNFLARIYTDREIRESFFLDPHATAQQYNLTNSEIKDLIDLSKSQIEDFSHSLINKRFLEVKKKLDLTSKALGKRFPYLFYRFAQASRLKECDRYIEDCFQFVSFIERSASQEQIKPWVIELMQYDIQRIKGMHSKFFFQIIFFRCGLKDLLSQIMKNPHSLNPKPRINLGIWIKISPNRKLCHVIY